MSTTPSKKDFFRVNPFPNKLKKCTSSELEIARHENIQLEAQNRTLKSEIQDLMIKNENLMEALNLNKERFEEDFTKLHDEIRQNESHLVENSRKCLEQQKKYVEEVKRLKQENENLQTSRSEVEKNLIEKLKSFESENKLLKLENENLTVQNKDIDQKCFKYKTKLKHAVKIVNEMNQIVLQYRNKTDIVCETTQTDSQYIGNKTSMQDCSQCGDPRYKKDLNSENLMLSDIFFKPKSFLDSEMDLFAVKSRPRFATKSTL